MEISKKSEIQHTLTKNMELTRALKARKTSKKLKIKT
jgi:hypothetical protein